MPAQAAGGVVQLVAPQLFPPAMGQHEGSIDIDGGRCTAGHKTSPSAQQDALRSFMGSSGQYPQNGRVRVLSSPAEALYSQP